MTKNIALGIDRHLHRNRSILLEILGKNQTKLTVPRILLVEKKFHFKYMTHYHLNKQGKIMHYVYDMGWMEFSSDEVLLIRNKTIE